MKFIISNITIEGRDKMRPVIGICINHSFNDQVGDISDLGFKGQDWQLLAGDYVKAVELAGGAPIIIPVVEDVESIWEFVKGLDGIVFTGGSDIDPYYYDENPNNKLGNINPFRNQHEVELCKRVLYDTEIPILGICRGLQLINITAGGTLYQDLETQREKGFNHRLSMFPKFYASHQVEIQKESKLGKIFGKEKIGVNSFHHQAIKDLGKGLVASMKAVDGLTEGIELEGDRFVVAVQWHPEAMVEKDEVYLKIFFSFVDECKKP